MSEKPISKAEQSIRDLMGIVARDLDVERIRCCMDVCAYCGARCPGWNQIPVGPNSAGNWIHERKEKGDRDPMLCAASSIYARRNFIFNGASHE